MEDMLAQLEKLRAEAQTSAEISRLATDPQKRTLFARLADELNVLADAIEQDFASGYAKT